FSPRWLERVISGVAGIFRAIDNAESKIWPERVGVYGRIGVRCARREYLIDIPLALQVQTSIAHVTRRNRHPSTEFALDSSVVLPCCRPQVCGAADCHRERKYSGCRTG